jgi:putative dimethyl sulfoxide reductase chaperone
MAIAEPVTVATLITNRTGTYQWLARLYRVEIDQPTLDRLTQINPAAIADDSEMGRGYRRLGDFLARPEPDLLIRLAVDYARIFLGASMQGATADSRGAYPYESVYTSTKRLLMQEARDEVIALYRREGLERSPNFAEPEDHLAFELEFMAFLGTQASAALQAGDPEQTVRYLGKQSAFLEQHLLRWLPDFCADVQRIARHGFYPAIAQITLGYLQMERALIGDLMAELQTPALG